MTQFRSRASSQGQRQAWRSVRPIFRAILHAAGGDFVDPAIEPDDVFDMLIGTILHRTQLIALGIRSGTDDHTVDLICRALRPALAEPNITD